MLRRSLIYIDKKIRMKLTVARLVRGFGQLATVAGKTRYLRAKSLHLNRHQGYLITPWRIRVSDLKASHPFIFAYLFYI